MKRVLGFAWTLIRIGKRLKKNKNSVRFLSFFSHEINRMRNNIGTGINFFFQTIQGFYHHFFSYQINRMRNNIGPGHCNGRINEPFQTVLTQGKNRSAIDSTPRQIIANIPKQEHRPRINAGSLKIYKKLNKFDVQLTVRSSKQFSIPTTEIGSALYKPANPSFSIIFV